MSVEVLDPDGQPAQGYALRFRPNSWAQQRFLESEAPDLLYSGHFGSSKTRALCEKLDARCRRFPNSRCVLARLHREHLGTSSLPIYLEQVVSPGHRDWGWRKAEDGGSTLYYPNGSCVIFVGLDYPKRLMSAEFDLICVDECTELDERHWDDAGSRLRRPTMAYHQIAGACNPESPGHWLYRRFQPQLGSHVVRADRDLVLPGGRGLVPAGAVVAEVIVSGEGDNAENIPASTLARYARYRGRYRERNILGRWISFEGLVYDCWDPALHRIARPAAWAAWGGYPPPDWPRVRGVDFGGRNPTACVWLARSPFGSWYAYREAYRTGLRTADLGRAICESDERELEALRAAADRAGEEPPEYLEDLGTWCDHDLQDQWTLAEAGVPNHPARKDLRPGIEYVYQLLAPHEVGGRRFARLYVVEGSLMHEPDEALLAAGEPTCGAEEIEQYRYPAPRPGQARDPREDPEKRRDHFCDALRYALFSTRHALGARVIGL